MEQSSSGIVFQWNSCYPGPITSINILMWTLFVVVLLLQFIKRLWFPSSTSIVRNSDQHGQISTSH